MVQRKIAIASCLLLLSVIRVTAQTSAASSVEAAKRYVVPILCVVRDAKTGNQLITFKTLGSGFIIERDGVFITAQHVIKELRASRSNLFVRRLSVFRLADGSGRAKPFDASSSIPANVK